MIYLVGGAPRCGKTHVAKKLAATLHVPWISTDTLESIVVVNTEKGVLYDKFPKIWMRLVTKNSNDLLHDKYTIAQIVSAYKKHAASTFKAIESFVESEVQNGHDYILEGHQIHPRLVKKLQKMYPRQIKAVFLVRQDVRAIVEGARKNIAKYDWFLQKTKNEATYFEIGRFISRYSAYLKKEAGKHRFKVINTDKNFEQQIEAAVSYLR